jgi:predicted N-acyltransferase
VTDDGRISVHSSIDEIDRDEWSAVVAAADAPAFYSHAFVRAYERVPLQPTEAFYYLVFGSPAVAVLPAYLQSTDDPLGYVSGLGLPDREPGDLLLMTHVAHCYDTLIAARPGYLTRALVDRACATLAELAGQAGAKWFAFLNVDGSGTTAGHLEAAGLLKLPMTARFSKDIAGYPTFEDFVAEIPTRKGRWKYRSSLARAQSSGLTISDADPVRGAAGAVELCRQTTARHGTAGYYPAQFHDFVALASEIIKVTEVRIDDRLVSATISLLDPRRFHLWAAGVDRELAQGMPSSFTLILHPSVVDAIRMERPVLEAGRSNEATKQRFNLEPRPLFAYVGRA